MENPYSSPKFEETIQNILKERSGNISLRTGFECNNLEDYSKGETVWTPREKALFCCFILKYSLINEYDRSVFFENLLRQKLEFIEKDLVFIIENHLYKSNTWSLHWRLCIKNIEKFVGDKTGFSNLLTALESVRNKQNSKFLYNYTPKIEQKIDSLIAQLKGGDYSKRVRPFKFGLSDDFGEMGQEYLNNIKEEQDLVFQILHIAITANGAKPSSRWFEPVKNIQNQFKNQNFTLHIKAFLKFANSAKVAQHRDDYLYLSTYLYMKHNADTLKGIIWASLLCYDKETLQLLAQIVEKSYQKIPGTGPAAAAVGNAALYVLANVEGLEGVNYLSRLKLRIKQSNTQALIEKYLNEAAESRNVSKLDLEDIANDDFGLDTEAVRIEVFKDYKAELRILGIGKTEVKWYKPDGTLQKTEPSFMKTEFSEALKSLKNDAKQIQTNLTTQRDRLDRIFRLERKMPLAHFKQYYLEHGLMSFLTRRLIWSFYFKNGEKIAGIFMGQSVLNENGEKIEWNTEGVEIGLWHPALETVESVQKWRSLLEEFQIQQPLKQAYREIYWLTDAEVNTGTYSNRFAAHILKQHQFNSLAKTRGWRYSLLGAYDKGYESEIARLDLPEYGLRAEFWVSEVNADGAWNDTGIYDYVATDQVRFHNIGDAINGNAVPLHQIPKLLFSEILRDVDLFVGVASVGNDPQWRDNGGLHQFRNYWESYSFGSLNETAKVRKSILEKILPKLKIAKVAHLEDKFLVVKGTFRSYKIHLGSTNILMTPNDQYLCIVPDRSKPKDENVYLPFEGDAGLSVIISKAFLLANDDKITDSTITSQIHRK